jgi:biopolymer transport protein ExbB/TolQ
VDGELDQDRKYLRAALTNQYNVILMLGAGAFALALASWLPVIIALLGEAAWFFVGPRLETFRQHTDALAARAATAKAIESLSPEYARRVTDIEADAREIESLCNSRHDLSSDQKQEVSHRLRPAVQAASNVCVTQQRLRSVAARVPIHEITAEVSSLHQSLSTETDLGVRASLRRALNVAERRLRQFESSEAAVRSLDLALQMLQKSLAMLKEGAAGLSSGPEICAELDAAMSQLSRAAALEAERELEFGAGRMSALPPALN